MKHIYT